MPSWSRYLAMVRRATLRPFSASSFSIAVSERGFDGGSSWTMCWMVSLMLVLETWAPSLDWKPEVKKVLSSMMPCGVSAYFPATALEMVAGWTSMTSASSFMVRGLRAVGPCSRKPCCLLTISSEILRRVC